MNAFTVYPSSSQKNALAMLIPHCTMTLDLDQPGLGERLSSGMQRRPSPRMELVAIADAQSVGAPEAARDSESSPYSTGLHK